MIWFLLLPVGFLVWMALGIRAIQHIREGAAINPEERHGKALLIIDMQAGFLQNKVFEPADVALVKETIKKKIDVAQQSGQSVFVVQHQWSTPQGAVLSYLTAGGAGLPGKSGSEVLPSILQAADRVIVKSVQDSFESGELDRLLAEESIGELHITGLDGLYCVNSTAKAALQRGYRVSLVTRGILASNKEKWAVLLDALQTHRCFASPRELP